MEKYVLFLFLIVAIACQGQNGNPGKSNTGGNYDWLIPPTDVLDGGPGKDGIPALENPEMTGAGQVDYLDGKDLVIGYKSGEDVRAYSHKILDWHEIINDQVGSDLIAITYCPLTGTGIGWNRTLNHQSTTFGVSGLLYNSNLIPYDRLTHSNWSQVRLDCVNGNLMGKAVKTFQVIETTWDTWQQMYPNTKVISTNTGYSRNYARYPYGDYRTNDNHIIFPVNNRDHRLPAKDRVLGVIVDHKAKVYPVNDFGMGVGVILDEFHHVPLVVAGSTDKNFATAFESRLSDGTPLTFQPVQNALPVVMKDHLGNQWDIFGVAVSGPNAGQRLVPATSFIGYWFAWGAFYPGAEIYSTNKNKLK